MKFFDLYRTIRIIIFIVMGLAIYTLILGLFGLIPFKVTFSEAWSQNYLYVVLPLIIIILGCFAYAATERAEKKNKRRDNIN